jgi:hypothetical protein
MDEWVIDPGRVNRTLVCHDRQGGNMEVDFTAFAEDCILTGRMWLVGDRLTDFLGEQAAGFEIGDVTILPLDDGRRLQVPSMEIAPADLLAVTTTGPRGNAGRRIRTRPHPIRAKAGPYSILGYLHAAPTADRMAVARRRALVPLTSAVIRYGVAGSDVEQAIDGLLLNRDRIDWLQPATDDELKLSKRVELGAKIDPQAKDMTTHIYLPRI